MMSRALPWLDRFCLAATLALPVFYMHGRGIAEVLMALIDLAFVIRCATLRDWSWLRAIWVRVALAWWLWVIICSLPGIGIGGPGSFVQALVQFRFPLLVAALETTILAAPTARKWLQYVLAASALYIAAQTWLQFITGKNLGGYPRLGGGELTGPFMHPRAAAPLSRLFFPTMLPVLDRMIADGKRFAPLLLAIAGVGTIVLINQRMPLILTIFGLFVTAYLLPRLRRPLIIAVAAGAILLAASPILSPHTFNRQVSLFSSQMAQFANIDYGQMAIRAVVITADHPVMGLGYDGFRNGCPDPRYFRGLTQAFPDGGAAASCNIHPHNHYLEAATNAGIPGLILFSTLIFLWLRGLASNLAADPLRVGLFVSALIQEWPISAHSGYSALEIAGFFFLIVGYGLALSRAAERTEATSPSQGNSIT